jgi:hypothetical protein
MNLVWKLLRQHISIPQFLGFVLANLIGMFIVMLGYQFYCDVMPVFSAEDSFMRQDFLILSKRIGAGNTLSGRTNAFSQTEIDDLGNQDFTENIGLFTRAEYKLEATMGIQGKRLINSELFFESVPDRFVDVPLAQWKFSESSHEIPIILPRSYIAMYNFGFAQAHDLPQISDGLASMIDVDIYIHGNGKQDNYKGRVIGFSSRLNAILVPEAFMKWSNEQYAPTEKADPKRLIVEVKNPGDEKLQQYLDDNGYELDDDDLQREKTTYFLRMLVGLVMAIGLVISILSFYILMLSIYLLVQKNSEKLENLLLIGYSPSQTARPYQLLTFGLNIVVFVLAALILWLVRGRYLPVVEALSPEVDFPTMQPALLLGLFLLLLVTVFNFIAVRRKVTNIWHRR